MENLSFLTQVNLYWILFYAFYWLLLRNLTFFRTNRIFLIGSLLAAFVFPLIRLPNLAKESIPAVLYHFSEKADTFVATQAVPSTSSLPLLLFAIYLSGVLFMLFQLLSGLRNIFSVIRREEAIQLDKFRLIILPQNGRSGSFSFFNFLFVNHRDYNFNLTEILRHESVHIRQRHSADVIFIEILKVLFWFNPILWAYKYSIQQVHEFLADEDARDRETYSTFLISYARHTRAAFLTNTFFNASMLKTRITMLYRNRSPRWLLVKYTTIIPVIVTILFITSAKGRVLNTASLISRNSTQIPEQLSTSKKEDPELMETKNLTAKRKNKSLTKPDTTIRNPEFPGGKQGLTNFLAENLKYPDIARQVNVEGIVLISFVVGKDGHVHSPSIIKGIGFGLDKEALRLIDQMPAWKAATKNGQNIESECSIEIPFYFKKTASLPEKTRYYSNYRPAQSVQLSPLDLPFPTMTELGGFFKKSFSLAAGHPPKIDDKKEKLILKPLGN